MSPVTQSIVYWTLGTPAQPISLPPSSIGNWFKASLVATGDAPPGAYFANVLELTEDVSLPDGGFVINLPIKHLFGGPSARGGREAIEVQATLTARTAADNPNRNYVGIQTTGTAESGDGGASSTVRANAWGAVFGLGAMGWLKPGATNLLNVTAAEFDIAVEAGASVYYKSGIQVCGHFLDGAKGSVYDCMYAASGRGAVGFDYAFLIGDMNGSHPLDTDSGIILGTTGAGKAYAGIDLSSYTLRYLLKGKDFWIGAGVDGPAISMTGANARIFIGKPGGGDFPGVMFGNGASIVAEGAAGVQMTGSYAIGAPTGGFTGPGTVNAENGIYDNGRRLTDLIAALTARVAALEAKNPH